MGSPPTTTECTAVVHMYDMEDGGTLYVSTAVAAEEYEHHLSYNNTAAVIVYDIILLLYTAVQSIRVGNDCL